MAISFRHPDVVDIPGALGDRWRDLQRAAAFLTCLPLAPRADSASTVAAEATLDGFGEPAPVDTAIAPPLAALTRSTALFPIVGAGIGVVAALALLMSFELGLHPLACALVALGTTAVLTGALHEDGLADFVDGVGGGRSREERLAIMRDSRIGTFGTLAIVFGVGLRAAILNGLSSPETAALAVVAAASVSRATLPAVMRWQQPARADGLSAGIGAPTWSHVIWAMAFALSIALFTLGFWASLGVCVFAGLAALSVAAIAERMLGGHTGDVLGAVQVAAEIAVLATVAAIE